MLYPPTRWYLTSALPALFAQVEMGVSVVVDT